MKLIFPAGPLNGLQTLQPVLQAAFNVRGTGIPLPSADHLRLSRPYRGYSLSLDALAAGKGLSEVVPGVWHYLVFADNVVMADARLTDKAEFSSLNYGPVASATVSALTLAENSAQLRGKVVELRMLFVSALHFVAVWLHTDDENILIPVDSTPAALIPTALYEETQLISLLIPAAKGVKKCVDADSGGQQGY